MSKTILETIKETNPGNVGVCNLCGREGYWNQRPGPRGAINFLAHSCPVKNKIAKEKRDAKKLKDVKLMIKTNDIDWRVTCDVQKYLFENGFAYDEADCFSISKEEEAFSEKFLFFKEQYIEHLAKKQKLPTKTQIKKMIKEMMNQPTKGIK